MMYALLRQALFNFSPESVHHFAMNSLRTVGRIPPLRRLVRHSFTPKGQDLATKAWGLNFRNPVGLAAGFDKNALYLNELDLLGFGFVEIGTVTPHPQPGNVPPRLFRLPQDKALINRMGFNNDGAPAVATRIRHWREGQKSDPGIIVGGNIGKNKDTPNESAWKDYERCFLALRDCVDYFVVNVSSPNTPGLRALQGKEALGGILSRLQHLNSGSSHPRPLLLKIAPDLTAEQLDDVIELSVSMGLDGLVAANTTLSREGLQTPAARVAALGPGGLSGRPLKEPTTELIRYIHKKTGGGIPVIGSGGIFTGKDAREKMDAGACLIQVWTGFIYEGPGIAKRICKDLSHDQ